MSDHENTREYVVEYRLTDVAEPKWEPVATETPFPTSFRAISRMDDYERQAKDYRTNVEFRVVEITRAVIA